jgi:precorrin-6B methylase 2
MHGDLGSLETWRLTSNLVIDAVQLETIAKAAEMFCKAKSSNESFERLNSLLSPSLRSEPGPFRGHPITLIVDST